MRISGRLSAAGLIRWLGEAAADRPKPDKRKSAKKPALASLTSEGSGIGCEVKIGSGGGGFVGDIQGFKEPGAT
jgi:hypothetical protein